MSSGQIRSRPHTTDFPQMVVKSKGNPFLAGANRDEQRVAKDGHFPDPK